MMIGVLWCVYTVLDLLIIGPILYGIIIIIQDIGIIEDYKCIDVQTC